MYKEGASRTLNRYLLCKTKTKFFLIISIYYNLFLCYFKRNLMSNPLVCTCSLKWLKNWLKESSLAIGNPKCQQPEHLKDFILTNLNDEQLACSQMFKTECDIDEPKPIFIKPFVSKKCPKDCKCLNGIVRCSHLKLTHIPSDIPDDVQEL